MKIKKPREKTTTSSMLYLKMQEFQTNSKVKEDKEALEERAFGDITFSAFCKNEEVETEHEKGRR